MIEKLILDVTCGSRGIWFQKDEPHTIYCDRRREEWDGDFGSNKHHKHLSIDPDIMCDFTSLPFRDEQFQLVVFDPPHVENLSEASWMRKGYGSLDGDWRPMIRDGFRECMRVLRVGGGAYLQMVGHIRQHKEYHQRDRARTAIRAQERKENEHPLAVLHEI